MAQVIIFCLFAASVFSQITVSSCRSTVEDGAPHFPPLSSYIYNGQVASPGSWPWQILLKVNGKFECGGSIINNDSVVTAAHCVDGPKPMDLAVYAGVHDRLNLGSAQRFSVLEIKIHKNYKQYEGHDDIAVLKTSGSFKNSTFVRRPKKNVAIGTQCMTTGWGGIDEDGTLSDVLKQTTMTIFDPAECTRRLPVAGYKFKKDLMLCTYDAGSDTCGGDSGGPLVCKDDDGDYTLYGITSWGKPTCGHGPDAFVRVRAYSSWIHAAAGAQEVCTNPLLVLLSWSTLCYFLYG